MAKVEDSFGDGEKLRDVVHQVLRLNYGQIAEAERSIGRTPGYIRKWIRREGGIPVDALLALIRRLGHAPGEIFGAAFGDEGEGELIALGLAAGRARSQGRASAAMWQEFEEWVKGWGLAGREEAVIDDWHVDMEPRAVALLKVDAAERRRRLRGTKQRYRSSAFAWAYLRVIDERPASRRRALLSELLSVVGDLRCRRRERVEISLEALKELARADLDEGRPADAAYTVYRCLRGIGSQSPVWRLSRVDELRVIGAKALASEGAHSAAAAMMDRAVLIALERGGDDAIGTLLVEKGLLLGARGVVEAGYRCVTAGLARHPEPPASLRRRAYWRLSLDTVDEEGWLRQFLSEEAKDGWWALGRERLASIERERDSELGAAGYQDAGACWREIGDAVGELRCEVLATECWFEAGQQERAELAAQGFASWLGRGDIPAGAEEAIVDMARRGKPTLSRVRVMRHALSRAC